MTKHMPQAPVANRSDKGPGDHHEVGSDTTHEKRPDDLERVRTGRHRQHQTEHDEQGLLPRPQNEIAARGERRRL